MFKEASFRVSVCFKRRGRRCRTPREEETIRVQTATSSSAPSAVLTSTPNTHTRTYTHAHTHPRPLLNVAPSASPHVLLHKIEHDALLYTYTLAATVRTHSGKENGRKGRSQGEKKTKGRRLAPRRSLSSKVFIRMIRRLSIRVNSSVPCIYVLQRPYYSAGFSSDFPDYCAIVDATRDFVYLSIV